MSEVSFAFANSFIISSCVVGFLFGVYNWWAVMTIDTKVPMPEKSERLIDVVKHEAEEEIRKKLRDVKNEGERQKIKQEVEEKFKKYNANDAMNDIAEKVQTVQYFS